MPKITKILLLVVSVVLVLTVFLGVNSSGVSAATEQQEGAYRQIDVYSQVLRHIQTDYVEEPNINSVTNGALRGLLESLDADSSYLTPEDYKTYKADKGGKAQVGINVSKRYGYATVVSVVPGSPADKANLNDGDIIEAIGSQDTRDLSLAMIQLLLEGQPGSELTVSVVRPRKPNPDKVTMTRTMMAMPPVSETMYENASILYLKPVVLDHDHVQQVEAKLKGMSKAGNKKILLDLRDVAAGDMTEATRLANMLLKSGTIAMLEGQKVQKQTFTADPSKAINANAPVVVLVNRGTAGPGELVAAALLENKRAEVVGEKTFGEGAQQKTFELSDGAALILSVAKYESPSGKKLQDEGVTPGVLVASNTDDGGVADDDATPADTQPAPAKSSVTVDEQLTKALDILKGKAA
ncbi:carboxyl-terminal processing protease [Edaphobacter aggregans]|uniref:Carboxyl-terminal processing protease n=1 Tax=Edaphobacter aggregans TaxID=570835 RepID=A0A428MGX2_9BACT|nr:S41 family peptidase [Edaphobacter aggregans]RSL16166.1 carboxyl-terminal processing protease [Edaphobacter aggregans]